MNLELVAALGAAVILSAYGSGTTDTGPVATPTSSPADRV